MLEKYMKPKEKNRKPTVPKLSKDENPKQGFNFYWIYGLLALVFLALQIIIGGRDLNALKKVS